MSKNEQIQIVVKEIETINKNHKIIQNALFEIAELTATFIKHPEGFNLALNSLKTIINNAYQSKRADLAQTHFDMLYPEEKNDSNKS